MGTGMSGTGMSGTGSDSQQDDKGAHPSDENLRSTPLATWGKVLPFLTSRLEQSFAQEMGCGVVGWGEGETSVKRIIDIDAELGKPWDKIACLEKETRLETWQYFTMKHIQDMFPEVGISMQEARGGSAAQSGTSSLWKWAQNKGWVWSSVPNGNNGFLIWDSFSQTSRTIETNGFKGQGNRQCWECQRTQWQALMLPSPQRKLTTTKVAWSNLI